LTGGPLPLKTYQEERKAPSATAEVSRMSCPRVSRMSCRLTLQLAMPAFVPAFDRGPVCRRDRRHGKL